MMTTTGDWKKENKNKLKRLNGKYPEKAIEANTHITDFHGLEATREKLNRFERCCMLAASINPSNVRRLMIDLAEAVNKFPNDEKVALQMRKMKYTDQEIADCLNKSKRTVIRKINSTYRKVRKIFGTPY